MAKFSQFENGQFNWVDLLSHDIESTASFYEQLFGWSCRQQDTQGGPPYGVFELKGERLAGIGQMPEDMKAQGVPPMWNSYINVEDLSQALAKTEELGGKVTMPAMQVVDAGHMAGIQDPSGGMVFLWQKIQHIGATWANAPNTWCWNELATRDVSKAKEFFAGLLQWEFEKNDNSPGEYYICKTSSGRMNGGIMAMDENWGDIPPHWTVYFTVADAETACEKVKSLGGNLMHGPFDAPEVGKIGIAMDKQGAAFNIIQLYAEPD